MIDDDLETIKILSLFENWGPISDQIIKEKSYRQENGNILEISVKIVLS